MMAHQSEDPMRTSPTRQQSRSHARTSELASLLAPFSWLIAILVVVSLSVVLVVVVVLSPALVPLAGLAFVLRLRRHRAAIEAQREATSRAAWLRGEDLWQAVSSLDVYANACHDKLAQHGERLEAWRKGSRGVQDDQVRTAREQRISTLERQAQAQGKLAIAAWSAWVAAYWRVHCSLAERHIKPVLDQAEALASTGNQHREDWLALAHTAREIAATIRGGNLAHTEPTAPHVLRIAGKAKSAVARITAEGRESLEGIAQRTISVAEGCEYQAECLEDQKLFGGSEDFHAQLGQLVEGMDAARRFGMLNDHMGRLELMIRTQAELDEADPREAEVLAQVRTLEEIAAL